MDQVLAPGLVVDMGELLAETDHTPRASTSCGSPPGTLIECVTTKLERLKRMIKRVILWRTAHSGSSGMHKAGTGGVNGLWVHTRSWLGLRGGPRQNGNGDRRAHNRSHA